MSSFEMNTFNPKTKKYETAWHLDDYFGPHEYGIVFGAQVINGRLEIMRNKVYTPKQIRTAEARYRTRNGAIQ